MHEHNSLTPDINHRSKVRRRLAALTLTGTMLGGVTYSTYAQSVRPQSVSTRQAEKDRAALAPREPIHSQASRFSFTRLPDIVGRSLRRLPLPGATHTPPRQFKEVTPVRPSQQSPSSSSPPSSPSPHPTTSHNSSPQHQWFGSNHYKANIQTANEWHNVALAYELAQKRRWFSIGQMACLDNLWSNESNFNEHSENSSSGAYGIPQSLPGDKMASAGNDWRDNAATQEEWGFNYIEDRYETPCTAWEHEEEENFY